MSANSENQPSWTLAVSKATCSYIQLSLTQTRSEQLARRQDEETDGETDPEIETEETQETDSEPASEEEVIPSADEGDDTVVDSDELAETESSDPLPVVTLAADDNTESTGTATTLPESLKIQVGSVDRVFDLVQDQENMSADEDGMVTATLELTFDPMLGLMDGQYPVTTTLYSDSQASVEMSSSALQSVDFSECTGAVNTSAADEQIDTATMVIQPEETQTSQPMASATPAMLESEEALEQQEEKTKDAGISAGVLGFALLCVVGAGVLIYRRRQRAARQAEARRHLTQNWMEEV